MRSLAVEKIHRPEAESGSFDFQRPVAYIDLEMENGNGESDMACYRVHPIHRSPGSGLLRRDLLTVGAVAGLGLSLSDFFAIRSAQAEQKHYDFVEPTAQSVIQIFLPGGLSAQESFDPKPYAEGAKKLAAAQAEFDAIKKAVDEAQRVENKNSNATRAAELAHLRAAAAAAQSQADKELFEQTQALRAEYAGQ